MSHPRRASRAVVMAALAAAAAVAGCGGEKKLTVSGLAPNQGDYMGGTPVDIKGTMFQTENIMRNAHVYFGDRQGVVVKFDGDTDLWVTAPGGDKGKTVDVTVVFEPGGKITIPKAFTYVEIKQADIDDLSTGSGSASGSSK